MQRPVTRVLPVAAVVLVAALTAASCGSPTLAGQIASGRQAAGPGPATSPPGPAGSPSVAPGTPAPATPAPGAPGAPASGGPPGRGTPPGRPGGKSEQAVGPPGCDNHRWLTVAANQQPLAAPPPAPQVTRIRMGTHPQCGFDRIVIHFRGRVPGYEIKYVSRKAAGHAARSIAAPGDHYLLITVYPAQSQRRSGASTVSPAAATAPFPTLRGYALASDFEGVVSIAAVVAKAPMFRVGIVGKRLFVDVRSAAGVPG